MRRLRVVGRDQVLVYSVDNLCRDTKVVCEDIHGALEEVERFLEERVVNSTLVLEVREMTKEVLDWLPKVEENE